LLALEAWYQGDENMQHHITELEAQIQKNRHELAQIAEVFEKQTLAIDEWEADLMQKETDLNNRFASLQQEETHLKVQAKLSEFADNLIEGQPCTLCGALDCPIPRRNRDMAIQLHQVLHKQAQSKDRLRQLKTNHQTLTTASVQQREKSTQ